MHMKTVLWALLAIATVGVAALILRPDPPLPLRLAAVSRGTVELTVSNTRAGTIKACRRSGLSMPGGGRVEALHVREGQQVAAGQLLLELWNLDRKALVAQAEAQFAVASHRREQSCVEAENATREARRLRTLLERRLASQEAAESAETRARATAFACRAGQDERQVAQAGLELQRALLAETQLRAPFPGIVAKIEGELGEFVTPSPPGIPTPPAIDLIDYSCLYVTAPIDEVDAGRLHAGQLARVTLDAFRDRQFAGRVERIAPYVLEIEKQARTVTIDVKLDNADDSRELLVGYSADVDVLLESREGVLRIPSEALLEDDSVYRFDPDSGRIEKRKITPGIRNWNWTEVQAGLAESDRIVMSLDVAGLADGVRAVPDDT